MSETTDTSDIVGKDIVKEFIKDHSNEFLDEVTERIETQATYFAQIEDRSTPELRDVARAYLAISDATRGRGGQAEPAEGGHGLIFLGLFAF